MLSGLEVLMGVRMIRVDDRSGKVIEGERGDGRAEGEQDLRVSIPWLPALDGVGYDDLSSEERLSLVGHLASLFKLDRLELLKGAVGYDGQPLVADEEDAASVRRRRAAAPRATVAPPAPAATPKPAAPVVEPALIEHEADEVERPEALAVAPRPAAPAVLSVETPMDEESVAALTSVLSEVAAAASKVADAVVEPPAPEAPPAVATVRTIDGDLVTFSSVDGIDQTASGWFWTDSDGVPVGPFASLPMARMNKMDVEQQQTA